MKLIGVSPILEEEPLKTAVILVVEDEILIRIAACDELRDAGFRVIEADSADEALAIINSGVEIDLVLTDVRMPGTMDGLALRARIQQSHPQMPVIITSGHLPSGTFFEGRTDFLSKPYDGARMINLIQNRLRCE